MGVCTEFWGFRQQAVLNIQGPLFSGSRALGFGGFRVLRIRRLGKSV